MSLNTTALSSPIVSAVSGVTSAVSPSSFKDVYQCSRVPDDQEDYTLRLIALATILVTGVLFGSLPCLCRSLKLRKYLLVTQTMHVSFSWARGRPDLESCIQRSHEILLFVETRHNDLRNSCYTLAYSMLHRIRFGIPFWMKICTSFRNYICKLKAYCGGHH